ncbi:prepilin-type N-terminal cleavage/methylation domain-containing protein [Sediminibacillus terrae]|uniref:prepilin-type N-terminal cleavage/methylation domain-containing protein n=1 Tax=Sediminibacillus terrae TaxID=1562106 RepID=UPI0013871DC1|nr:prepilin-type N-terminal cleavage/methylation domain-containing protein [Sediminibacillus terrae]
MTNNKGFTLVELLAVLALLGLIITLAGSVSWFGQKQYTNQLEETKQQSEVRLALKQITKDVRQADSLTVTNNQLELDEIVYRLEDGLLLRDGRMVAEGIADFLVKSTERGTGVKLKIKGASDAHQLSEVSTVLYIRE